MTKAGDLSRAETKPDPLPRIRVFGGIGIEDVDGPVNIGGPRQQRLFALLVIRSGSFVDIAWLAENLWSDDERPATTARALRTYVSRLRQALPKQARSWLVTETAGYRLDPPRDASDRDRFRSLREAARNSRQNEDPLDAMHALDEALSLSRGTPFRELEDVPWARAEIEQLQLDRLEMVEERFEAALALGRHTQITGELAAFTSEHRLRDRAARQLALALHRSGRTAEALRAIASHRTSLAEASGLDPSSEMVKLEAALLAGDPALGIDKVGRPLRGYRLLEEIGSGAFAVVWRGVQPSVEREVAIKQIRSELASQPEFIRSFEAEAHLIARIEHPHIVPLIDYWRDPDSAYLVMRWLQGGTLERLLDDGPLGVTEALALARQIGGALAAAHSHGVVHRDVKTSNIFLDSFGNAFLGDFGIALDVAASSGPEAALSPGSPAYASPEQIRQEPLEASADVFSLGVVIFECLAGELPFSGASSAVALVEMQLHDRFPELAEFRDDVPEAMASAIARATAKVPSDRFATIDDFVAALDQALPDGAAPKASSDFDNGEANPYMGLHPFDSGDHDKFFGRERLVTELVDRLSGTGAASRCLLIVGPSGSGKSSVARAGLLPALRAGAARGSENWFITTMTPSIDPFAELEAALLRVAVSQPSSLSDQLRSGHRGILRGVRQCLGSEDDKLMLLIDQSEELFTMSSTEDAALFLDALAGAVHDPTSPLRVLITLRADYYDRPLQHPTFASIVKETSVQITPLAPDELEQAIVEPARSVGLTFEPGLVARMTAEVTGQPSPLPLLQFTLSELFDRRRGNELTIASYEAVGGIGGALSSRAEAIFHRADETQRTVIRRLFGRMINPRLNLGDLRRRVFLADLGGDLGAPWVLDQFGAARLLSFDHDHATREPTVEVAHEALLREWPRLVDWIAEDLEVLRALDAVGSAAAVWDRDGRPSSDLYRGGRLEQAQDLAAAVPERLRPVESEFIAASQSATDAVERAERARVTRLRRLVGIVAVALVASMVAGTLAFTAQRRAAAEADAADLATLISRSAAQISEDPDLAILLALEAHGRSPGPETEQAILNALGANSVATRLQSLDFTPEAPCSAAAGSSDGLTEFFLTDGQLTSRDVETGTVTTHGPPPDGTDCVVWMHDAETNRKWAGSIDARTHWFGAYDGPWEQMREFEHPTFRAKWNHYSTNRLLLVTETPEGPAVTILDDISGERVGAPLTFSRDLLGLEVNDSGTLVAAGFGQRGEVDGDGHTFVLDALTGEEVFHVVSRLPSTRFVFDDEANELVTATVDGRIQTIDLRTGDIVAEVSTTTGSEFLDLGIQPDGSVMVVSESQVEFVDRRAGPVGPTFDLRRVGGARIRPDGRVTTFTTDDRTNLLDFSIGNALVDLSRNIPRFANVTIKDGLAGVATGASSHAEVIDLNTGERRSFELTSVDGTPVSVDFVNPGTGEFWGHSVTERALVRFVGGEPADRVELPGIPVFGFVIGDRWGTILQPDVGETVAALIRMDQGDPDVVFSVPLPEGSSAYPHPGGGLLTIDEAGHLRLFDGSGQIVFDLDTGHGGVRHIDVDAETGRIAFSPGAGGLVLVDPRTGTQESFTVPDRLAGITFVRNGEFLILNSADGTVRLWDVERGSSAGVIWDGSGTSVGAENWYDSATDSVWVSTSTLIVRIPLDPDGWVEQACQVVGRELTDDERIRLVPAGAIAGHSICGSG